MPDCPSCEQALQAEIQRRAALPKPAPSGRRQVRTLAQARAAFPTPGQVTPATRERLAELKARFLTLQPEPRPQVAPYLAKYQAMFTAEGLAQATPEDLRGFVVSVVIANPGNLGTFYKAWEEQGPDAMAASLRATIEYLLRGKDAEEEDRLTEMVGATKGVGIVLLTKILCITQPERFLALLPYESDAGKGKQAIGDVVFGLRMPDPDSTGMTRGRLAYWSNDLLRETVQRLPGEPFVDLEHAKEFLWNAFCHLQGWPSEFDKLPAAPDLHSDPAERAIAEVARELTRGQGYSDDPAAVEKVGMDVVAAYFEDQKAGWTVMRVDQLKCGWDLEATRGDQRWCVEVKATSGKNPSVFVTANELAKAEDNPEWVIAVVTSAMTGPDPVRWWTAADVIAAAVPKVYQAKLEPQQGTRAPGGH